MISFYGFIGPELTNLLSALLGAVIGSVVGGLFTLVSVRKGFDYGRKLQEAAQLNTARGAVLAIRTELETLWEGYYQEIGSKIEKLPTGEPLNSIYRLTQNYFSVYEANCGLIGLIDDEELRSSIVGVYAAAKGLFDTHLINNELIDKRNGAPDMETQMRARFELNRFAAEMKAAYQLTHSRLERARKAMDNSEILRASARKHLRA